MKSISIYSLPNKPISKGDCDLYRQKFLDWLLVNHGGYAETLAKNAIQRLDAWFSHEGFQSKARPENLGEKLARIVWVEVDLSDSEGSNIVCKARITEWEAPFKIE